MPLLTVGLLQAGPKTDEVEELRVGSVAGCDGLSSSSFAAAAFALCCLYYSTGMYAGGGRRGKEGANCDVQEEEE